MAPFSRVLSLSRLPLFCNYSEYIPKYHVARPRLRDYPLNFSEFFQAHFQIDSVFSREIVIISKPLQITKKSEFWKCVNIY